MARKTPQCSEVQHVSARRAGEPIVDAALATEQSLTAAGVNNVGPHLSCRDEKMRNLIAAWWLLAVDVPSECATACRTRRRDEHARLVRNEMR